MRPAASLVLRWACTAARLVQHKVFPLERRTAQDIVVPLAQHKVFPLERRTARGIAVPLAQDKVFPLERHMAQHTAEGIAVSLAQRIVRRTAARNKSLPPRRIRTTGHPANCGAQGHLWRIAASSY